MMLNFIINVELVLRGICASFSSCPLIGEDCTCSPPPHVWEGMGGGCQTFSKVTLKLMQLRMGSTVLYNIVKYSRVQYNTVYNTIQYRWINTEQDAAGD